MFSFVFVTFSTRFEACVALFESEAFLLFNTILWFRHTVMFCDVLVWCSEFHFLWCYDDKGSLLHFYFLFALFLSAVYSVL